ncbi:MAG TPA: zinc-binding dehydrogenase [Solirubrobacteraceae bacterium]|nr:zinc-binding dehydrogenase [Solirubrobacteraceae bacterium]
MHAIRLHAFGPATNLRYEEVDDPVPGPGQARIEVAASGVHLVDTLIRAGHTQGPLPPPELPAIPGREVAGRVDAVGEGVEESWIGRRAVAHLGAASAGYAELAVAGVDALHELPDGLSEDAAVAMIGTGRTTLAILELAELTDTDVALVTAAAGGIGWLLLQAASNAGATVVGAAGGEAKVERVRQAGADLAVDYSLDGWSDRVREALDGREVTVALDGVGGPLGRGALELIGLGGRLIMFGSSSGEFTPLSSTDLYARGLTVSAAIGPRLLRRPGGLRPLEDRSLAAAAAGELVPLIGQRFPLAEAAAAHLAIERRATVGKTVLVP